MDLRKLRPHTDWSKVLINVDTVPAVINMKLISKAILRCTIDEEKKKIYTKEEIDILRLEKLYLEFYCILRIDHLWMFKSLKVLSVANNQIEKIENLEALTNLVELNLSFNNIKTIENLEALVNIEILSLFDNKIKKIENLDELKNLKVFSIGNNEIADRDCVQYLRRFKELISVTMSGNPCAKLNRFKEDLAAYVPNLIYYDYKKVTPKEREIGRKAHRGPLKEIEMQEQDIAEEEEKARIALAKKQELEKAFMDGYEEDAFYENLFENDADGQAFQEFGEKVYDIYNKLKEELRQICSELFEMGQENCDKRLGEVDKFEKAWNRNMSKSTDKMHKHSMELMKKELDYIREMRTIMASEDTAEEKTLRGLIRLSDIVLEFGLYLRSKWFALMDIEMKRYEKNEEVIAQYERNLIEINNGFMEAAQGFYRRMRDSELDFMDNITERLNKIMINLLPRAEDLTFLPPHLRPYMKNKDMMNNAILTMHEEHMLIIDTKEDQLMQKLKNWQQEKCGELVENEMKRNRQAVLRIKLFLEYNLHEFCMLGKDGVDVVKKSGGRTELVNALKNTLLIQQTGHPAFGKRKQKTDDESQVTFKDSAIRLLENMGSDW